MSNDGNLPAPQGEFLIYQTEDGHTRVQVRVESDTVWLSQRDMAELFQTTKQNVSLHIQNVFDEGELLRDGTVKEYLTVQTEGNRQVERRVEHYNMGLATWTGDKLRKGDVAIAKNYLNEDELKALNLIVSAYLDFAELQALNRKPMHMADWIAKLDDFIRITERDILTRVAVWRRAAGCRTDWRWRSPRSHPGTTKWTCRPRSQSLGQSNLMIAMTTPERQLEDQLIQA